MSSKDTVDLELHKETVKHFRSHFDLENNSRIIFSAPFGVGKTTFLKEYFKDANQIAAYGQVKW